MQFSSFLLLPLSFKSKYSLQEPVPSWHWKIDAVAEEITQVTCCTQLRTLWFNLQQVYKVAGFHTEYVFT